MWYLPQGIRGFWLTCHQHRDRTGLKGPEKAESLPVADTPLAKSLRLETALKAKDTEFLQDLCSFRGSHNYPEDSMPLSMLMTLAQKKPAHKNIVPNQHQDFHHQASKLQAILITREKQDHQDKSASSSDQAAQRRPSHFCLSSVQSHSWGRATHTCSQLP